MVIIRLSRGGSKKRPKYRVTVADSRRWRDGKFLEVLGHYNPHPRGQEQKLVLDLEKTNAWLKQGAQPTERVASLIRTAAGKAKDSDFDPKAAAKAAKQAAARAAKTTPKTAEAKA